MPSTLTPEARAKVEEFLARYAMRCVVCGNDAWGIVDIVEHAIPTHMPGEEPAPSAEPFEDVFPQRWAIPAVAVSCRTCGQLLFFSARKLGLLPSAPPVPPTGTP